MTDYVDSCPNCSHTSSGGYAVLYRCDKCRQRFCYKCPASAQGNECPKCGSTSKTEVARIQR